MRDLTELSKKLGALHCEVWQFHDQEVFEDMAMAVHKLLVCLGFYPQHATEAAEHIKHAYICADMAVDAMDTIDVALEQRMYEKVTNHLEQARTLLNLDVVGGVYEAKWWQAFRHRNGAEVSRLLYEELHVNTRDPEFASLGASILFAAGAAHSKRDWRKVETLLQKYWQQLLEHKYCFLAGGL